MNNEEKILELLNKLSQEQDRQGAQLEEVHGLSQKTAALLETEVSFLRTIVVSMDKRLETLEKTQ